MSVIRNGRDVTSRPYHRRLTALADHLQAMRDATFGERKIYLDRLCHRAWQLTPDHFAHFQTRAELNWQKYLRSELFRQGER